MKNVTRRKFLTAGSVAGLAVGVVAAGGGAAANSVLKTTLDTYVGSGDFVKNVPEDKADWDGAYYDEPESADAAMEAAYDVAARIQDEGTVLLKNNGVLPLAAGSTVMPFGYAYLSPIYGQLSSGGSAKWVVDPVTPEEGLASYTIDTSAADLMAAATVEEVIEADGTNAAGDAETVLGGDCVIYEYNPSIYDGLSAVAGSTGVVFVSRSGQEGQDQKFDAYEDGTPHYLALTENEKGAIAAAKAACDAVVLVIVGSAAMEMGCVEEGGDYECDAIVHYGHPGERGMSRLSAILSGEVNPSGRTVDIWPADFTADPTYVSLGKHAYSNLTITPSSYSYSSEMNRPYNEYKEGMYIGYRYYETAALVDSSFDYDSAVVYPFGWGLSYTTFEQTLDDVYEADGEVTARVTVTNTGSASGKCVIELYSTSPYTSLDEELGIEKPACQLVAFDKTSELAAGEAEELTFTFSTDDLTSYAYAHENSDGTQGCYVLEAGDYVISLRENSHDVIAEATITFDETTWYDGSDNDHIRLSEKEAQSKLDDEGVPQVDETATFVAATNLFQDSSDYMNTDSTILSRADWAGTQPYTDEDKTISDQFTVDHDLFVTFDYATDPTYGNVEGSLVYAEEEPTSGADNGLTVSDMRGLDYDDEQWDLLLDQIDWDADADTIKQNFSGDAYVTAAIPSIGLPPTVDMDGANGLKVSGITSDGSGYDMSASSSTGFAPLMAATWNKDLLYEMGAAFGQESIAHGIAGWYCPAINLHRSPFSGRVFEYYSEDPLLSGTMAERAVSGAGDQGMYCYLKHFAVNEIETYRDATVCTWADEQAMRELYFRPFEIAIKGARMTISYTADSEGNLGERTMRAATAVMAAQDCIGTMLGHTNYALLTSLLREEWGFRGMVISDYWVWNSNALRDLCIRTGCDTYLCMYMSMMWSIDDYESATARSCMRNAIHNIAYTVANSNAMQGMVPGTTVEQEMSPWQPVAYGAVAVGALLAVGGIVGIAKAKRLKAEQIADGSDVKAIKKIEKKAAKKAAKEAKKAAKAAK